MVNNSYENGKVYFIQPIVNHEEGEIYVGSTKKFYLSQRMNKHRSDYKRWKNGKATKLTLFDLFEKFGVENCKIILLENYPCQSKDELTAKEAEYIKKKDCVNKIIPGRTRKEYLIDNKQEIQEYYKKIAQKIIECPCGINYKGKSHKNRHEKTTRHIENMTQLNQEEAKEN